MSVCNNSTVKCKLICNNSKINFTVNLYNFFNRYKEKLINNDKSKLHYKNSRIFSLRIIIYTRIIINEELYDYSRSLCLKMIFRNIFII